mmetsp:Transcript_20894/g.31004  ORF Transcript_20894/g.31004 Transcript_20894/m.31004 type:complete len:135 (-) Transcript_20894:51-455(-)|eukprot:CAMPEP_0171463432 /NCGR_PEP_ID=MMETSP0945-20130129/7106_1 /TAXON_ID=109269 /ORGANISM="Vaucheria litorea, Strain CCMP2940" /LENGTH=134 /DNA_ID=CAMNT_0011990225 /DNA_START=71 /DNA_END=475 /DNA_ORIENTATION=+
MPKPLETVKIVKKRTKKFARHFSNRFIRIRNSGWRRPKGIDSRVRRKFKGSIPMPNIGYGSNRKTRNILPCGFKKFSVHNVKELEMLLMHNRKYAAEIATQVSAKQRKVLLARAAELDIKVLNVKAKLGKEENA